MVGCKFLGLCCLCRLQASANIIGARIKSECKSVKEWILSLEKKDKTCYTYKRENGEKLIVSYSESRARKDDYNRKRGVERLRKASKSGHLTKQQAIKPLFDMLNRSE